MPAYHSSFRTALRKILFYPAALAFSLGTAQAQGTSGSISGTVTDPTGAVIPNAAVAINNPVTNFTRATQSGSDGSFHFYNIPFNTYRLTTSSTGFDPATQSVAINSLVPLAIPVKLTIAGSSVTPSTSRQALTSWKTTPPSTPTSTAP